MSIRIGITDGNRPFFERFRNAFRDQFGDEFEIYLFPDLPRAVKAVEHFHIRAVLLEDPEGQLRETSPADLPDTAFFARLCDRKQEEKDWEREHQTPPDSSGPPIPLLCRFRSTEEWRDLLLREIAALPGNDDKAYEQGTNGGGVPGDRDSCKVVLFTSAAGGTGASTAARGFAEYSLRKNRRTLYLDLQTFPDPDLFPEGETVTGDDLYTLEDIFFALRGRRYAPDALVERAVKTTESGFSAIAPPKNPGVLFDFTGEEIVTLLDIVRETQKFSLIILDMNIDSSERITLPILSSDRTVLVSDGSRIANRKTQQMMDLLPSLSTEAPAILFEKICLLYNRFRKGKSTPLETEMLCKLGGVNELDLSAADELAGELSCAPAMERLYELLTR